MLTRSIAVLFTLMLTSDAAAQVGHPLHPPLAGRQPSTAGPASCAERPSSPPIRDADQRFVKPTPPGNFTLRTAAAAHVPEHVCVEN